MAKFEIEVSGQHFSGETASAKEQLRALHIAANGRLLIGLQESVTDKALVLMLLAMSWEDLQLLETLLVREKLTRCDDGVPVAGNLFRDDPASYALLIGKVARENLAGFYKLPGGSNAGGEPLTSP